MQARPASGKPDKIVPNDDLIGKLRTLSIEQLHAINSESLSQSWDESLEILGEEGVKA